MKPTQLHIIISLFLTWSCLFSQNYTNYTVVNGLPSNHVYTIRQDTKGFIWFLTDKGMVKYSGSDFKKFTTKEGLPNNDVWGAIPTPDNKVWYLSKTARLGYIYNDSVYSFPNEKKNEIMNPLSSYHLKNKVYQVSASKTHQLVNGVWKVLYNRPEYKMTNTKMNGLELTKDNSQLIIYGKNNIVKAKFKIKNNTYKKRRRPITDSLYFLINEKGYDVLNMNTLQLHQKLFKNQLNQSSIKHPRINLINNRLQISGSGFVAYLDKDFNIVNPFLFPENLQVHFGLIDKHNTIWGATFNNGVYKIPYNKREAVYSFLDKKIQHLNLIEDELFVSVYNDGFYKYDPKSEKFNLKIKSKKFQYGAQYLKETGVIYFLSKGVIYSKENKKIDNKSFYRDSRKLIEHKNQLYGLGPFGINQLNSKKNEIEKCFFQEGINDVLSHNNQLYIATSNGLKVLKNEVIQSRKYKELLGNKSILNLKKISDTEFLINTDGFGTYIANDSKLTLLKGTEYLSVNNAFILDDQIWLATNKGVLYYEKNKKIYNLKSIIDIQNGLPINNVNTIAVLKDKLFIGTDNGLVCLPKKIKKVSLFLNISIEEILYNSKKIKENTSTFYRSDTNLNSTVSIIDFSDKNKNKKFRYKLLPIQNDWNISKTLNLNYNNLQPNDYQFVVQKKGIEKTFSFTIKPLWWQTLTFKIAVIALELIILFLIIRFIVKYYQKIKTKKLIQEKFLSEIQLRALRSQMNPHFVFNSLAAIQYYINDNNYEASETYLVKFSKLIRQFFELSKENEILLKEEIKLLQNYLEIEQLRFGEKLNFSINIDQVLEKTQLKIPTMLLQPVVENAVNHGIFNKIENGNVFVKFEYRDSTSFFVKIIDDGVGFFNTKNRNKKKKHNSSNIINNRIKFLNQTKDWKITLENKELNPCLKDKGNQTLFTIIKINKS